MARVLPRVAALPSTANHPVFCSTDFDYGYRNTNTTMNTTALLTTVYESRLGRIDQYQTPTTTEYDAYDRRGVLIGTCQTYDQALATILNQ